ncbi:hypothetical protein IX317_002131 [Fusobacterium sp. DD29]|nr:hypothetical protein [Fusobacterium sp. DD29]MBR8762650.1 hypothetical protein [Fusobacterium sp. DD25]MBR8768693.1 hypothetical protein [Fusobacterium sp. DD43]MBR8772766.1 hypothetical protein [Fusobacterium sp. DD40]MBR8776975.1 hypothetical protein [Fusobacterium sp. DD17]MBR8799225.1 hypothetical protein [Fusobacterium sp. DD12]MBR8801447.1 hypothetical protein [Fusobacterium sp. DD10]MBR8805728.1 hypothetical protein [Fusobacterium sp. DD13]MBR8812891.1 hypothetical protein [Fusoba
MKLSDLKKLIELLKELGKDANKITFTSLKNL